MTADAAQREDGARPPTLWLCDGAWQAALEDELLRTGVRGPSSVGPGLVATVGEPDDPAVAFAAQVLPSAEPCRAESIARWSQAACARIVELADAAGAAWRLHVFAWPTDRFQSGSRRAALVRARIVADLRESKRRLARRLVESDDAPWEADERLVQVCLTAPDRGYVSAVDAQRRHVLRRCLSRFAAGWVPAAVDKRAPSRAFAKLVEVERRLGRPLAAGETCVDLGSSPGSWAYTAVARGARVTAVDRSPLRDDLMRDPRLTFVRGDAFRFAPSQPVDWLLSDVIAFPQRVRELLDVWLTAERCRYFCVTVKFRGRDDDPALEDVKRALRRSPYEFCLRRLTANKNEATAYGRRRSEPSLALC